MSERPTVSILIVDDDPGYVKILKIFIQKIDLDVQFHVDAVEYVKAAERFLSIKPVDLIFFDVLLPDSNGAEDALKFVKKMRPRHIVVISSMLEQEFVADFFKAGAIDYLSKDYLKPDRLSKIIKHVIFTEKGITLDGSQ